jgi:2-polyprenyl-3-methyl-5-hydroxy-6-metoxy-1,4-benzoquinol methylase
MNPKCPLCNFEIDYNNYSEKYVADFNNQEYKLYHCPNCDAEWWEPLKIIPEFYENEGELAYALYHTGIRTLQEWHLPFFKNFSLRGGRLLDVGCGDGVFIKEAQKLGFEAWGIDFDKKSIEIGKNKFGLKNVYALSLEEFVNFAKEKNIKFDVITFFEVLEHQDKPKEFLEQVKMLLKSGGWIAGTVPNRESIFINLYRGKYEKTDLPPHHFLRFSKKVLKNFFEQNGFLIETGDTKSLSEISTLIEVWLIGRYTFKLKKNLRAKIYSGENISKNLLKDYLIKMLKSIRAMFLMPLSIIIYPFVQGAHIYFQGKLK